MLRICSLFGLVAALSLLAACRPESGPSPEPGTGLRSRVAVEQRVVDGDTLVIAGERLRLAAIDAPELKQTCGDAKGRAWPCGRWAKERLTALLTGPADCRGERRDRYGRRVVRCSVGGIDLGAAMVVQGAARAYLRYGDDYAAHEARARSEGRGIWTGRFTDPEKVRHPDG